MCYHKKCISKDVIKAGFIKRKISDLMMFLFSRFCVNEDFDAITLFS